MQKSAVGGPSGTGKQENSILEAALRTMGDILRKKLDTMTWCQAVSDFAIVPESAEPELGGKRYEYAEIKKLHKMLEDAEIPHIFCLHHFGYGYSLRYPSECSPVLSAVEFPGSYGCEKDLIEIHGLFDRDEEGDDVLGYQTAYQVFDLILKHYQSDTVDLRDYLEEDISFDGTPITFEVLKNRKEKN